MDGGYEVVLDVTGRQFEADGDGVENEVPLDTWFQVAVFPESDRESSSWSRCTCSITGCAAAHSGSPCAWQRSRGRPPSIPST